MAEPLIESGERVCYSADLVNGEPGVRFYIKRHGQNEAAFVVRHGGVVSAFINRCAHKLVELDWEPGRFFDATGELLICSTHGALYDPFSGLCVAGPCRGARLTAIPVVEHDGSVWLIGEKSAMLK